MLGLDGLVGVGIGADGDHLRHIALARQFPRQHRADAGPGDQPRLEVEPRRQVQEGVAGPREAVDAAMLAAPVGVDRTVEGQIGRAVVGQR